MAITKMEKLALAFKLKYLDEILQLIQGFQGIHIETPYEPTIPSAKKAEIDKDIRETEKNLREIHDAYSILKGREKTNLLSALKNSEEKKFSTAEFTKIIEESN